MAEDMTTETVEFLGKDFHIAEDFALMALMEFGKLAESGDVDDDPMAQLAVIYDFLEQAVHPQDWKAFKRHAIATKADEEQLLEFTGKALALIDARPTRRSSDSSDGPRAIEPSSPVASSSPDTAEARVIEMFNSEGRPDLALMVRKRQESLTG